jgi:hypothetical protein
MIGDLSYIKDIQRPRYSRRKRSAAMATKTEIIKQKAYHEMRQYLVIALYLWVVFSLFVTYKSIILRQNHIDYAAHGVAVINALVLGKFMLIARALRLGESKSDRPLIYPTVSKSALFAVVLGICKLLEDILVGAFHGKSMAESIADLGGTWTGILALCTILFVLLIPFFAVNELDQVLGDGKLKQLFFHAR